MPDGLTLDDLNALLPAGPDGSGGPLQPDDDRRAEEILAAIYRKHGIAAGTPVEAAIQAIQDQSEKEGEPRPAGFANKQDWMKARKDYTAGSGPGGMPVRKAERDRWNESIHVLDDDTFAYQQKYGRDLSFLESELPPPPEDRAAISPVTAWGSGDDAGALKYHKAMRRQKAIETYANTENQRLARRSAYGDPLAATSGGYADYDGWGPAFVNAVASPDTTAGFYLDQVSDAVPHALRTSWSNPKNAPPPTVGAYGPVWWLARALTDRDAWNQSREVKAATRMVNPVSPSPRADLPSGASGPEIASRIKELTGEIAVAGPAPTDTRWQRAYGYAPPSFMADGANLLTDFADPTAMFPVTKALLAGRAGMRASSAASKIAGAGWRRPFVQQALAPIGKDAAVDVATDAGTNVGISTVAGGEPGRSWRQFVFGGGKPGKDFAYTEYDPEAVSQARRTLREALTRGEKQK